jgi:hypothetical protein
VLYGWTEGSETASAPCAIMAEWQVIDASPLESRKKAWRMLQGLVGDIMARMHDGSHRYTAMSLCSQLSKCHRQIR